MLQQTRVETVIPYYERFLELFPTVHALAEASEDQVLSAWSGLGYYRRARLFHAGAKKVVDAYGGQVPVDPELRRAIPGVGRYTAAAIGSIAFDLEEPLVDGNVARVFCRWFEIDTPLETVETEKALWTKALEKVEGRSPGDWNQALMELGATICTPVAPACDRCPVRGFCGAFAHGRVSTLPIPKPKKKPRAVRLAAVVAYDARGQIWLRKQETKLFGGLFGVPFAQGETHHDASRALADAGIAAELECTPIGSVVHVLTHRRLEIAVFRAYRARATASACGQTFASLDNAPVGIAKVTKKIVALAESVDETKNSENKA